MEKSDKKAHFSFYNFSLALQIPPKTADLSDFFLLKRDRLVTNENSFSKRLQLNLELPEMKRPRGTPMLKVGSRHFLLSRPAVSSQFSSFSLKQALSFFITISKL